METLTKEQIIDETVAHYSVNPDARRSVIGISCAYNGPNGTHCAVGRCMLSRLKRNGRNLKGNTISLDLILDREYYQSIDEMLSPKYRGHEFAFWSQLQKLHDSSSFWRNAGGLTDKGMAFVRKLKKQFAE